MKCSLCGFCEWETISPFSVEKIRGLLVEPVDDSTVLAVTNGALADIKDYRREFEKEKTA